MANGDILGLIIEIAVAIILIVLFYSILTSIGGIGYGLLFVIIASLAIVAAIVSFLGLRI